MGCSSLRFDAVVRTNRNSLYRFCLGLCEDAEDAEDLAQDVFVRAYESRDGLDTRTAVANWLYTVARNCWKNSQRSREADRPVDEERTADPRSVESALRIDRLSLEHALQQLAPGQRAAFLLVKSAGFKYREAAELLDVSEGTVHRQVHDATKRLRKILRDEEGL